MFLTGSGELRLSGVEIKVTNITNNVVLENIFDKALLDYVGCTVAELSVGKWLRVSLGWCLSRTTDWPNCLLLVSKHTPLQPSTHVRYSEQWTWFSDCLFTFLSVILGIVPRARVRGRGDEYPQWIMKSCNHSVGKAGVRRWRPARHTVITALFTMSILWRWVLCTERHLVTNLCVLPRYYLHQ